MEIIIQNRPENSPGKKGSLGNLVVDTKSKQQFKMLSKCLIVYQSLNQWYWNDEETGLILREREREMRRGKCPTEW